MLRPERMSKVSVTGAKAVMTDVIEAVHELNLVHLSDYDGSWEGFENGRPIEGAEMASERLVTIRSLERTLDLDTEAPLPDVAVDPERLDTRLDEARVAITELEDDLSACRDERRQLDDRIEQLQPFATLGIELDLLRGYDHIDAAVGYGHSERIATAFEEAAAVGAYDIFTEDDVVALFAASDTEEPIQDALVGIEFTQVDVPPVDGNPETEIRELRNERAKLESKLRSLEADMDQLRHEYGDFLRAAERYLTIEVDQAEAPLRFATTEHAFVAEGWIPAERFDDLETTVGDAVGDRAEIERLRTAAYGEYEHDHPHDATGAQEEVATDGGTVTMDDEPPVVLDNPKAASPFELLTNLVNRPKYSEIDPTMAVFLTFPFAFGFMIGDIGYGVLYLVLGWYLLQYDSRGFQIVGMIAAWCGSFTILFGWLFDDTFGIHLLDFDIAALQALEMFGVGFLSKGVQSPNWLMTWILASLFFGWVHLNTGLIIRFVNELNHGWKVAIFEAGSWILAMNGFVFWLFSHRDAGALGIGTDIAASGAKPEQFFGAESVIAHTGFVGLPEMLGALGLIGLLVGLIMVGIADGIAGVAESPAWVMGHFLSYLRIVAVLLGKGAMAFVVNLIVFGAYVPQTGSYEGYVLFNLPGGDLLWRAGLENPDMIETAFGGLFWMDPWFIAIPIAIAVFVVGHIIVLLLGITAAGIQMLRLEYVEFFQKFFEGGGREYRAFGPSPEPSSS